MPFRIFFTIGLMVVNILVFVCLEMYLFFFFILFLKGEHLENNFSLFLRSSLELVVCSFTVRYLSVESILFIL